MHELGWIEYVLPDGGHYFVHPTLRATTDLDLNVPAKLLLVTSYFERYKNPQADGLELWLTARNDRKRDSALLEWWVDHSRHLVSSQLAPVDGHAHLQPLKGEEGTFSCHALLTLLTDCNSLGYAVSLLVVHGGTPCTPLGLSDCAC